MLERSHAPLSGVTQPAVAVESKAERIANKLGFTRVQSESIEGLSYQPQSVEAVDVQVVQLVTEAFNTFGWVGYTLMRTYRGFLNSAEDVSLDYEVATQLINVRNELYNLLEMVPSVKSAITEQQNEVPTTPETSFERIMQLMQALSRQADANGRFPEGVRADLDFLSGVAQRAISEDSPFASDEEEIRYIQISLAYPEVDTTLSTVEETDIEKEFAEKIRMIRQQLQDIQTNEAIGEATNEDRTYKSFCINTNEAPLFIKDSDQLNVIVQHLPGLVHDLGHAATQAINLVNGSKKISGPINFSKINQYWKDLFTFVMYENKGFTEGEVAEQVALIHMRNLMMDTLSAASSGNIETNVQFADTFRPELIEPAPVVWNESDIVRLAQNLSGNAVNIQADMYAAGRSDTYKLNIDIDMRAVLDIYPYTNAAVKTLLENGEFGQMGRHYAEDEQEAMYMLMTITDNGTGIGPETAGILGPDAFRSKQHGYRSHNNSHGDGMVGRQENIESLGGSLTVWNIVEDPSQPNGKALTKDINDPRRVVGTCIQIAMPIVAKQNFIVRTR